MDTDLVQALQEFLGARLALAEEDRIERRRYAVLQAAAIIYGTGQRWHIEQQYMTNGHTSQTAVTEAEQLLADIERREKVEAES